eukprot:Rhum_TRINITY_DN4386_c0_g1::Rhum_TRINITY_DN4386_c0_g1_i1::g.14125::m.14125
MEEVVVKAATAALLRISPATGRYEVLLGQAPFDNFLKAEKDVPPPNMRYPGEYRIPGGALDAGERPEEAALRELKEELGVSNPAARLRLFSVRRTAVVRGRRHLMYNYVLHPADNPWTAQVGEDGINEWLGGKRKVFDAAVASGAYWSMDREEREEIAPEVEEARWWDVAAACKVLASSREESAFGFPEPHSAQLYAKHGLCQKQVVQFWREYQRTSCNPVSSHLFWNDYQHREMAARSMRKRDPMYQTLTVLSNVDDLPAGDDLDLDAACSDEQVKLRSNVDEW